MFVRSRKEGALTKLEQVSSAKEQKGGSTKDSENDACLELQKESHRGTDGACVRYAPDQIVAHTSVVATLPRLQCRIGLDNRRSVIV